ncbi:hypothetical protein ACQY0O_003244 [Thecaphora frezii]
MLRLTSLRTRRFATSSFFLATFFASFLTVSLSASTILPCPANRNRGTRADSSHHSNTTDSHSQSQEEAGASAQGLPANGVGQRVLLTRKGGWIEIEPPKSRS